MVVQNIKQRKEDGSAKYRARMVVQNIEQSKGGDAKYRAEQGWWCKI